MKFLRYLSTIINESAKKHAAKKNKEQEQYNDAPTKNIPDFIIDIIADHGIKYTLNYFNITAYLIALLLIIVLQNPVIKAMLAAQNIEYAEQDLFNFWTTYISVKLLLWGALIYIFTTSSMTKLYKYVTGRNINADRRHYKKPYIYLIQTFSRSELHKLDASVFPIIDWRSETGIFFGKDFLGHLIGLSSFFEGHICVFGPSGTGKTSGFCIPAEITYEGSCFVMDIKGDQYDFVSKHTHRKIVRFSPDDPHALDFSAHFDPLQGFNDMTMSEKKNYIKKMALTLVPEEKGSDGGYFSSRARKMFQGIFFILYSENGDDLSFPDVVHDILHSTINDWITDAIDGDESDPYMSAAQDFLLSFDGNSEKNTAGAYDNLTTALVDYSNPVLDVLLSRPDNHHMSVSLSTLEDGYDIYFSIQEKNLEVFASLFNLMIINLSAQFSSLRPDSSSGISARPILMVLDEFARLNYPYSIIESNLSLWRSKGIHGMLCLQSYSQLAAKYGDSEADSLLANCNYQLFLGSNDNRSSEEYSKKFRTKKGLRVSTTSSKNSTSMSVTECDEPIFPPEFFQDLEHHAVLYFNGKYIVVDKLNCHTDL